MFHRNMLRSHKRTSTNRRSEGRAMTRTWHNTTTHNAYHALLQVYQDNVPGLPLAAHLLAWIHDSLFKYTNLIIYTQVNCYEIKYPPTHWEQAPHVNQAHFCFQVLWSEVQNRRHSATSGVLWRSIVPLSFSNNNNKKTDCLRGPALFVLIAGALVSIFGVVSVWRTV